MNGHTCAAITGNPCAGNDEAANHRYQVRRGIHLSEHVTIGGKKVSYLQYRMVS